MTLSDKKEVKETFHSAMMDIASSSAYRRALHLFGGMGGQDYVYSFEAWLERIDDDDEDDYI